MTKRELLLQKLMNGRTLRMNHRMYYRSQNTYMCQTESGKQYRVIFMDIYNYCIRHWDELSW